MDDRDKEEMTENSDIDGETADAAGLGGAFSWTGTTMTTGAVGGGMYGVDEMIGIDAET